MSRTNIVIDDRLLKKVMGITGAKTKREAVDTALNRLVERASLIDQLKKFKGKLSWKGDLNQWRKKRI